MLSCIYPTCFLYLYPTCLYYLLRTLLSFPIPHQEVAWSHLLCFPYVLSQQIILVAGSHVFITTKTFGNNDVYNWLLDTVSDIRYTVVINSKLRWAIKSISGREKLNIHNATYAIKPQVLQSSIFGTIPAVSICFTTASRPSFGKMTLQCLSSLMLPWYFMYCPLLSISLRESAHLHNETLTLMKVITCIQTV